MILVKNVENQYLVKYFIYLNQMFGFKKTELSNNFWTKFRNSGHSVRANKENKGCDINRLSIS